MKNFKEALLLLASVLVYSSSGCGCFYFPPNYSAKLTEGQEEVFLFHDGENAHMVIRTTLRGKKFPSEIAWVIPFPSLPSKYEEINGPFFQELGRLLPNSRSHLRNGTGSDSGDGAGGASKGIKVHETVELGQYTIQPIEILKDDSAAEFNAWLKKNHFRQANHENQKDYLKKGAAFLAIRMQMNRPGTTLLTSKPLHVVYHADRLAIPIRFSHHGRTFDLDLYVFSGHDLKKDLSKLHLNRESSAAYENKGLYPFVDEIIGSRKGQVTLYQATSLNSEKKRLKNLSEDPAFLLPELQ